LGGRLIFLVAEYGAALVKTRTVLTKFRFRSRKETLLHIIIIENAKNNNAKDEKHKMQYGKQKNKKE
jgi:hypothetical protein